MSFQDFLKENLNTEFPPLYHGTSSEDLVKTLKFKGDVYLTEEFEEAVGYAGGLHLGGSHGKNKYVLTIMARSGKIFNGSKIVDEIIAEEHEDFEDLDDLMKWAKEKGYSYVTFDHPSFFGDDYYNVVVSLNPNKDLKVLDVEKVNEKIK